MYYRQMLDSMIDDLKNHLEWLKREIKQLPAGQLSRNIKPSGVYYQQRELAPAYRTKEIRHAVKDEKMLHELVWKRCVQEDIKITKKNLQVLEKAAEAYMVLDSDTFRVRLGGIYADLPPEMFTPLMDPGELLLKGPSFMTEGLIHVSPNGTAVRSKSELVIISRLEHYGLTPVYEPELYLDGVTLRPDFEIRRPRDARLIYWEHAGLMTDPEYRQRHTEKMVIYEQNGIVPWENLIVTYDNSSGGLDVRLVDGLIQGWLL